MGVPERVRVSVRGKGCGMRPFYVRKQEQRTKDPHFLDRAESSAGAE